MTRGKGGKVPEILSHTEKESLVSDRKDLESQLAELEEFGQGTPASQMDKAVIKKQIDRIDQAIAEREPPKVSGINKDRLIKEAHEIESRLAEGMPTRDEMNHPARYPGAVRKHMGWLKRNNASIERYRTIQRMINRDEPRSVEELRRDK